MVSDVTWSQGLSNLTLDLNVEGKWYMLYVSCSIWPLLGHILRRKTTLGENFIQEYSFILLRVRMKLYAGGIVAY